MKMEDLNNSLRERIFDRLFEVAEVAKFTREEMISYEDSLKYYRDLKNSLDTAFEEGKAEGKEEGKKEGLIQVVLNGNQTGLSIAALSALTGLSEDEVTRILRSGF